MMNFMLYMMLIFLFMIILLMLIPSNLYKFHPLIMGIVMIIYVLLLSFNLNMMSSSYWYSYIIFLTMVGGLMILFLYFTCLASNQIFVMELKYFFYFIMKFIFIFFLMLNILNYDLIFFLFNINIENLSLNYILMKINLDFMKNLLMDYLMDLNLYMIMYLFFTMICSILLCKKMNLPLRQMTE